MNINLFANGIAGMVNVILYYPLWSRFHGWGEVLVLVLVLLAYVSYPSSCMVYILGRDPARLANSIRLLTTYPSSKQYRPFLNL